MHTIDAMFFGPSLAISCQPELRPGIEHSCLREAGECIHVGLSTLLTGSFRHSVIRLGKCPSGDDWLDLLWIPESPSR